MARYLITASENSVCIFDFIAEEVDICTPSGSGRDQRANWDTLPITQVVLPSSGIETDIHPFPAGCAIDVYNYDAVVNSIRYDFIRSKYYKSLVKLATTPRWNVRVDEYGFPYITTFHDNGDEWLIKSEPVSYGGPMPLYEFDSPIGNVSARDDAVIADGCTLPEALAVIAEWEDHSA